MKNTGQNNPRTAFRGCTLIALLLLFVPISLSADEPKAQSVVFEYKPAEGQAYVITVPDALDLITFPVVIPATVDWVVDVSPDASTKTVQVSISDSSKLKSGNGAPPYIFSAKFAMEPGRPFTVIETTRYKVNLTITTK